MTPGFVALDLRLEPGPLAFLLDAFRRDISDDLISHGEGEAAAHVEIHEERNLDFAPGRQSRIGFRAVGTRFEAHDENYLALVNLAATRIRIRALRVGHLVPIRGRPSSIKQLSRAQGFFAGAMIRPCCTPIWEMLSNHKHS